MYMYSLAIGLNDIDTLNIIFPCSHVFQEIILETRYIKGLIMRNLMQRKVVKMSKLLLDMYTTFKLN